MATPFKHPKTGGYFIRRAVPKAIQEALGKTEYLKSLGTKDERQAKVLFPAALQECDAVFAKARGARAAIDVLNDVQIRAAGDLALPLPDKLPPLVGQPEAVAATINA